MAFAPSCRSLAPQCPTSQRAADVTGARAFYASSSAALSNARSAVVLTRVAVRATPPPQQSTRVVTARAAATVPEVIQTLSLALRRGPTTSSPSPVSAADAPATPQEAALLAAVLAAKGRGRQVTDETRESISRAIAALEAEGGVEEPTLSPLLPGTWELLFTTRPGTASPIQRAFVGVDSFQVFQQIQLAASDSRVNNIVVFGEAIGRLKVEAAASAPTSRRIAFQFDRAAFDLSFWPYRLPYPVPFRLLGDEAKGWLDTTYLSRSGKMRISKGNKGTTFVLRRFASPQERLVEACSRGKGVEEAIAPVVSINPTKQPATSTLLPGKWRLVWSSQSADANKLQQLSAGFARNFQIIAEDGSRLENVVEFVPGVFLRAGAEAVPIGPGRTEVRIDAVTLQVGPLKLALPISGEGYVDQLYLDESLRVSRGNKGSLFVHVRS